MSAQGFGQQSHSFVNHNAGTHLDKWVDAFKALNEEKSARKSDPFLRPTAAVSETGHD